MYITIFKDLHTVMHCICLCLPTASFHLLLLIVKLIYQVKESYKHIMYLVIQYEGQERPSVLVIK